MYQNFEKSNEEEVVDQRMRKVLLEISFGARYRNMN